MAAKPIISSVGRNMYAVSKNTLKGSLNPSRINFLMKFGKYDIMSQNSYVIKSTLGYGEKQAVKDLIIEHLKGTTLSYGKDL